MANVRRFFRYDVEIPLYFETVDVHGHHVHAGRRDLFHLEEETRLEELNQQINNLLEEVFSADSDAMHIFYMLNHRIQYMAWLLDDLIEGQDPRLRNDYKFRQREDRKHQPPLVKRDSKVGPLIQGFYLQIDDHLSELIETVQNSIDGKIFLFPRKVKPFFEADDYVTNLPQLASKGVLPAQTLVLLIEKLNVYETVFARLKQAFHQISDPDSWETQKVNLCAGGFAFLTNQKFDNFAHMNVFMQLDEDILVCRGKIVLNKSLARGDYLFRVAVEFEFLSSEHAEKITLFIQHKEIHAAMSVLPNNLTWLRSV